MITCPYCDWTRQSLGRDDWDQEMVDGHNAQKHPVGKWITRFLLWRLRRG